MRQLKQFFALMVVVAVILVIYLFMYQDDDVDPMHNFPPGLTTKERCEMIQKEWLKMEKLALDSSGMTNLVGKLVQEKGSDLNLEQQIKLAEKLTSWLYQLKTASFEDFMAFRKPDYYNIGEKVMGYVSSYYGKDPEGLNKLSDRQKVKALHHFGTTIRFDSLRKDSIHFNVRNWKGRQKTKDVLDWSRFYPDAGTSEKTYRDRAQLQYRVKPINVWKKYRGVEWTRFRAGFDAPNVGGYVFAIQIALYWTPDEKRWLPGEFFMVLAPPEALGNPTMEEVQEIIRSGGEMPEFTDAFVYF